MSRTWPQFAVPAVALLLVAGCVRYSGAVGRLHEDTGPDAGGRDALVDDRGEGELDALRDATRDADPALLDLRWIRVPAGAFLMGSPGDEPCRQQDEDQHQVTITRSFVMLATELTQATFQDLMGYLPARFDGCAGCPVENVSWHEAAAACTELSRRAELESCYDCTGRAGAQRCSAKAAFSGRAIYECGGFRLPSEAEWELAYRGGTTSASYAGAIVDCTGADATVDAIAWYERNAGGSVRPAGGKSANPLGLLDMAGNVWEWCHDGYEARLGSDPATDPVGATPAALHVGRGGAWNEAAGHTRAAYRNPTSPSYRDDSSGFRCARTLP